MHNHPLTDFSWINQISNTPKTQQPIPATRLERIGGKE